MTGATRLIRCPVGFTAAALLVLSCGDGTGPVLDGSVYSLFSVDGVALPHVDWEADGSVLELLADTLEFVDDDRVKFRSVVRLVSGAGDIVEMRATEARWSKAPGGRITLQHECEPIRSLCTVPDGRAEESGSMVGDTLFLRRDWFGASENRLWIRVHR